MKTQKTIIIFFIFFSFTHLYSQQDMIKISLKKFKVINIFLKTNLNSILSLEEQEAKENQVIYHELHLIVIKKINNETYDIQILEGDLQDVLIDYDTSKPIGYFYLNNYLFIVKGDFIPELFKKTNCKKKFEVKIEDNSELIPIIFDPEVWSYKLFKGRLLLVNGLIFND